MNFLQRKPSTDRLLARQLHPWRRYNVAADPLNRAHRALNGGTLTVQILHEAARVLLALEAPETDLLAEALLARADLSEPRESMTVHNSVGEDSTLPSLPATISEAEAPHSHTAPEALSEEPGPFGGGAS